MIYEQSLNVRARNTKIASRITIFAIFSNLVHFEGNNKMGFYTKLFT